MFFCEFALFWDYFRAFHYFRFFLLFSKFVIIDPTSLGQVFLIQMLLYVTLRNCATSKSKMCNVLSNLDGNIIKFNIFAMFLANVSGRRHRPHFWWKEPRQYTHWDLVETNVWHTTP
jgi:hypothetical protein